MAVYLIWCFLLISTGAALEDGSCMYNGQTYPNGAEISRSADGCTVSTCVNGNEEYDSMACSNRECDEGYHEGYVPGVCCTECIKNTVPEYGCLVNGTAYHDGETISSDESGCENLICSRGDVARQVSSCSHTSCAGGKPPVKKPEICCPVCEGSTTKSPGRVGCLSTGNQISVGDWVMSTVCTPCQCMPDGLFRCFEIPCPTPKCSNPKVTPDKCCPACPGDVSEFPCIPDPCNKVSGTSHTCVLVGNSYECRCDPGFLQAADKRACIRDTSGSQTVCTSFLLLIVPVLLILKRRVDI